jgi:hypothetical protein
LAVFEIAFQLKKTIRELEEMPYDELLGWFAYFEQRPIGWREDDRTHKLLQAQGVKEKAWKLFPSLDKIYNSVRQTDDKGLKTSMFFQKMITAKGGDQLNFDD